MMIRFGILPLVLALNFSMCKKQQAVTEKPQPADAAVPGTAAATAAPVVVATPKVKKPVVDQTAQTLIFCYHRLVDKVRYPGTEITPAAFEAQMKELKDKESQSFRCRIYSLGNGAKRTYRRAAL